MLHKSLTTQELGLVNKAFQSHLPNPIARSQIRTIAVLARLVVDLNLRGKQMAYQRSTEMKVRVSTDTATDTVWNKNSGTVSTENNIIREVKKLRDILLSNENSNFVSLNIYKVLNKYTQ